MKLFKIKTFSENIKSFIYVFIFFISLNNLLAFAKENKSVFLKSSAYEFEEAFFENSIPFNEYDNLESQLKLFLGRYSNQSLDIFYPDSAIINNSKSLREVYKSKLNDMSINEINYNDYK